MMPRSRALVAVLIFSLAVWSPSHALADQSDPDLQQRSVAVEKALDSQQFSAALELAQAGLAEARRRNNQHYIARFLAWAGIAYQQLGRYSEALGSHQQALTLHRQLADRVGEASDLGNMGTVYSHLGRYAEALASYQQALALFRQLGDRVKDEAEALRNIGLVYRHLGRYAEALALAQQALALHRQLGDRVGEERALGNIGIVNKELGRYAEALASHQEALALARQLGDRLGEASELGNIGVVYSDLGRYAEALASYQQALAVFVQLGDKLDEATALGDIGVVYSDLGRYAEALASQQEALALARQLGDRPGEAMALGNIGLVYRDLGRYAEALTSHQEALALARQLGDRLSEVHALGNIGVVNRDLGRNADAQASLQQALALARQLGDRLDEANALRSVGNVYHDLGRYSEALASHHQALALDRQLGDADIWRTLFGLARDEAALDRRADGLAHFEAAVEHIEGLRGALAEESHRRTFFATTLGVYDEYLAYLLELNRRFPGESYPRKALQIFEREQARAFLEEVGKSSARRFADVPPEVTAQEAQLAAALNRNSENLVRARSAQNVDATAVSELEKEQADLRQRQRALQDTIKTKYPTYYGLTHPQPIDPPALQQLLGPGDLMLAYGVLKDTTALWVIDRREVRLYALPFGSVEVARRVEGFLEGPRALEDAIDQRKPPSVLTRMASDGLPALTQASFALYQSLLPPDVQTAVANAKNLLIVPTGPLYRVPWETLVTRAPAGELPPHYLVEDHAVSYLSSASLLGVLRTAEAHRRKTARYPLVAFANPNFGLATPGGGSNTPTAAQLQSRALADFASRGQGGTGGFAPLPGTAAEVKAVNAMLNPPPESHPLYENDEASRANVLRLNDADCAKGPCLKGYRYVIFATHAVLPDESSGVLQPSLVMAHPEDNGYLTMGDVFGLSLDADVVSLSACNTGGGTLTRADGVRGLTQAFMYAGTPVVSVTLWKIEDRAGQQLTPAFYAGLKAGKSPAEALRAAKVQMLKGSDPLLQHPFFWAPTVIFGDGVRMQR